MNETPTTEPVSTREGEVSLLRSLALESRGRDGRQIRELADRIERGEEASTSDLFRASSVHAAPNVIGAYLAIANQSSSFAEASLNASRHEMATSIRRRLAICVLIGLLYWLAALLVGVSLFASLAPIALDIRAFYWWGSFEALAKWPMAIIQAAYITLALFTFLIVSLFAWRIGAAPRWLEAFWDFVPFVGSTLRSLDLAEMSHSIYQCVTNGQTYEQAFQLTARRTRSSRLKYWLTTSAVDLRAGQDVDQVLERFPIRGEWLSGWTTGLGINGTREQTEHLWSVAAERMFEMATHRVERACQFIPTFLMVLSAATASIALAAAIRNIMTSLGVMA